MFLWRARNDCERRQEAMRRAYERGLMFQRVTSMRDGDVTFLVRTQRDKSSSLVRMSIVFESCSGLRFDVNRPAYGISSAVHQAGGSLRR